MINIVEFGDGDRQLELTGAQLGRVLSIGTDWTSLCIGMRFQFDDVGINPGVMRFGTGVCVAPSAGFANGPLSGECPHFIGASTSWTTLATREAYECYVDSCSSSGIRAGTYSTQGGLSMRWSASASVRHVLAVTIVKSGANISVGWIAPTGAATTEAAIMRDLDDQDLLYSVVESGDPAGGRIALNAHLGDTVYNSTGANYSFALDEGTYGDLTSIALFFNRSAFGVRVSELIWAKLS